MISLKQYLSEAAHTTTGQRLPVNIIIGRFQPFTLGHLKCAEYAFDKKGVPTVLCCIETTKSDEKHPFLTKDIMPIMQKMVRQELKLADVVTVKSADIVKLAEAVREAGYEPVSWTCGTDRIDDYTNMAEKYHDMAQLPDNFEVLEVKRGDEDISATKVRNAMKAGDQGTYEKLTPKAWHKYFWQLKPMVK